MPGIRFTPQECAQIRAEYEAGASGIALAAKWDANRHTVMDAVKRAGGRLRTRAEMNAISGPARGLKKRKRGSDETAVEYAARKRRARVARGICGVCREPAVPGFKMCQKHRDREKWARKGAWQRLSPETRDRELARQKRRYEEKKKTGQCTTCERQSVLGKNRCEGCYKMKKETERQRILDGLCPRCGRPAASGVRECKKHLLKRKALVRAFIQKRKDAGVCIYCAGVPSPGRHSCQACRTDRAAYMRHRIKRRLDHGRCGRCGIAPHIPGSTVCEACYFARMSQNHFGTGDLADALARLLAASDGRCPYTGRKLTIGVDMELDHKVPLSRGGANDISNVQWVHRLANDMKRSLTEEEFFALVAEVYACRIALK